MKKKSKDYCVIMSINDEYFGSIVITAKDEHDCYMKFLEILLENQICLHRDVEIEIEEV